MIDAAPDDKADDLGRRRFCPDCGRDYPVEQSYCTEDGRALLIVAAAQSLVGERIGGQYDVLEELGVGGMGSVYRAHQLSVDREVAIKVLRRELSDERRAIQRFLREARAVSRLSHPNTVIVHDSGQTEDGLLYLVMELLVGQTLDAVLRHEGRLEARRAAHILAQICDSLSEAHAAGIVHRDLKPANIFCCRAHGNPEFVKVLDFGIAHLEDHAGGERLTVAGAVCGTPEYASPEQARDAVVDARSDVYSLGVLLYRMLAGRTPFAHHSRLGALLAHISEAPPPIPAELTVGVPGGVLDLVGHMLAKDPQDRPPTCQEVKAALLAAVDAAPDRAWPPDAELPPGPMLRAPPLAVAIEGVDEPLSLLDADSAGARLHSVAMRVPAGSRLVLVGREGTLGAVKLFARALRATDDDGSTPLAWERATSTGPRPELVAALKDVLGMDAAPEIQVARDAGGSERVLVCSFEPERPGVPALTRMFLASPPTRAPRGAAATSTAHALAAVPRAAERPWGAESEAAEWDRRLTPIFPRAPARGHYTRDGVEHPMECRWLGLSRCGFLVVDADRPKVGARVRVAVPTVPVAPGEVEVEGVVTAIETHGSTGMLAVEAAVRPWSLSQVYRDLVAHWRGVAHAEPQVSKE